MWHMHHPDYRDPVDGRFMLPWVYLHALKDYNDMAAHLERHPQVHAVVNFSPVLLDQVEAYCADFASGRLRDPLLALLARDEDRPLTTAERTLAIERCFQANHDKMIAPFAGFLGLKEIFESAAGGSATGLQQQATPGARAALARAIAYLSDRFFLDLVTWYHLAWTGETLRRGSDVVSRLLANHDSFTVDDRRALLEVIGEQLASLIPRYRRLADSGQIELSCTPQHHPIAPLLIDFAAARQAQPSTSLPEASCYPGGAERAREHLVRALASHEQRFGRPAQGVWPAEGGVSTAFARMLETAGVQWFASGGAVLANSRTRQARGDRGHEAGHGHDRASDCGPERQPHAGPFRIRGVEGPAVFFRDDRLSDLIGFEYRHWDSEAAAEHLLAEIERVAPAARGHRPRALALINDGENAWEYYPYNGYYFFEALYTRLARRPRVRSTTFSRLLRQPVEPPGSQQRYEPVILETLVAGSWVYGDFSTWIGSVEKNRAWDLLVAAKLAFDRVSADQSLDAAARDAARAQLAVCEASDWLWWPGPYNPAQAVAQFDALFRHNLARLYQLLGLAAPAELAQPISHGTAHAADSGAMRRSG